MGLRSIYIDTEHTFSSIRLLNMIGGFDSKQEHLLELVRTETVFDSDSLMKILTFIEEELNNTTTDQYPVLLIIDSIAAPLRMSTMGYSRENILLVFTDCAKRLAKRYNLLVLVTNQVTTKRRSNVLTEKVDGNDFYMSVALGKAWSYSVNVRLAISYQGDTRRQLIVGKSIESPAYAIGFRILTNGLEEIEDNINMNTQRKSFNKQSIPRLIQADEMHLIGKQLRP
jgi:RecA/RadA recombinase